MPLNVMMYFIFIWFTSSVTIRSLLCICWQKSPKVYKYFCVFLVISVKVSPVLPHNFKISPQKQMYSLVYFVIHCCSQSTASDTSYSLIIQCTTFATPSQFAQHLVVTVCVIPEYC